MIIRCKLRSGEVTEIDDGLSDSDAAEVWHGILESDDSTAICVEKGRDDLQEPLTGEAGRFHGMPTYRLVQARDIVEIVGIDNTKEKK